MRLVKLKVLRGLELGLLFLRQFGLVDQMTLQPGYEVLQLTQTNTTGPARYIIRRSRLMKCPDPSRIRLRHLHDNRDHDCANLKRLVVMTPTTSIDGFDKRPNQLLPRRETNYPLTISGSQMIPRRLHSASLQS